MAAFIDSKPRPVYPFKQQDYLTEKLPSDSVYYPQQLTRRSYVLAP